MEKDINTLIEENEHIVRDVINGDFGKYATDDDIYQIGLIALWNAVLTFKESKKVKFESWASRQIRRHIIDELRKRRRYNLNKEKYEFMINLNIHCIDETDMCEMICDEDKTLDIYIPSDVNTIRISKMTKKDKNIVLSFLRTNSAEKTMKDCDVSRRTVFYAIDRVKKDILGRL